MRSAVLLMALAICSIALAACGSSAKPSSFATTSASGSTQTRAMKFAQCMRSNGVPNYPDPSSSGRPQSQSLNKIDPNSPTFEAAYTACRTDLTGGQSGQIGPPAPTAAQLSFALSFAHCIRKHGFPQFPDPLTTYGQGFTLGTGEYFPDNSTYQLLSPAFRQAAKACGVQLPSGLP